MKNRFRGKLHTVTAIMLSAAAVIMSPLIARADYYDRTLSLTEQSGVRSPDCRIEITGDSYSRFTGNAPGRSEYAGGISQTEDTETVSWTLNIPESGLYGIDITYLPLDGSTLSPSRKLTINGELPFVEASKIVFDREWADAGKPGRNLSGDDVVPVQKEVSERKTKHLSDDTGKNSGRLKFYFNEGINTLSLEYINEPLEIDKIAVVPLKKNYSYEEAAEKYTYAASEKGVLLEAEDNECVISKSEASILIQADSDPSVTPYEATHVRLNTIGGYSWSKGSQEIRWRVNVPENGLYKIHLRFLQNRNSGLASYRSLKINSETPFAEAECITFPYSNKWQDMTVGDKDGNPYIFQFEKGENEISLAVTFEPVTSVIEKMNDTADSLRGLIFDITRITGYSPDPNYNYSLETEIPDLTGRMKNIRDNIAECRKQVDLIAAKNSTMEGNLKSALSDLDRLIERPTFISNRLEDLNTMLTNLSNWAETLQTGPLSLDTIELLPPRARPQYKKSSFLKKVSATFQNFIASFTRDYTAVSGSDGSKKAIDVWVSRGREWAQLIQETADSTFTSETGQPVNFHILPSGSIASSVNPLLLALSSGITPDAVMGLSYDLPVEYALRNTVCDLTEFADFKDISDRFLEQSLVPFSFNGKVFALPESISFRVMYYRTDIFENLGIKAPETWQELYDNVLPVLSRNNMKIFVPQIFDMFLYQYNGNYYTEDGSASALNTPEAYAAFKEFCELYTDNEVPVSANFYNRFRTGEIPLGIENASQYLLLAYAAPEIAGNWKIAPIPGHTDSDGNINRINSGTAVDGCIILENAANKNGAWDFLKWWTSSETQMMFSKLVEGRIGAQARWFSANMKAFSALPWSKSDRIAIESAFKNAKETPVVLGSYFSNRHLVNAINRTVIQDRSARDSLEEAAEQINMELSRRQKSYYKRQSKLSQKGDDR